MTIGGFAASRHATAFRHCAPLPVAAISSPYFPAYIAADLIVTYRFEGEPYLKMLRTEWQIRSESRWPAPDPADHGSFKTVQG